MAEIQSASEAHSSDTPQNTKDKVQIEHIDTRATYLNSNGGIGLSDDHRDYLLQRHGTLDLDPVPGPGGADPYNWPNWQKVVNLVLVAIHACMSTFTAAAIIPAYQTIAVDLGLIVSLVGNIGCAKSPDYASMAALVTKTFFKKDRARYIGIWTLMVTLGVPLSPFIFGFVAFHVGYRWIYWILAMINGVKFILYIFFGPETRYIRTSISHQGSDFKQEYFTFKRIDPKPFSLYEFIQPLFLCRYMCILIPAIAYAMTFLFGSVLITVELPQLFGEKFMFNSQLLGLQFLGIIIGSVIGEQLGGIFSDFWMNSRTKKSGVRPAPEYQLWLSYSGFIFTIVGVVVFLVRTQEAPEGHWNITPVIGIAIAGVGNQIVTTVLITYAVDCHLEESASIGVFINFVRQTWGFIGPFWFPDMFTNVGVAASAGVASALIIGVSIFPTMFVQWRGQRLRGSKEEVVIQEVDKA